ncbi:MAG TPA: NAD(P)/FAD-dependent oxidoreductase [Pseudonocardia sp.]|nr:NAD(P)/FAD-dependent oxidoreductase [Pseudonocardia sp.]
MRIVIVGAGFGGIAAAIELRNNGFDDITILEAADDFGGTWHHNTYPGAACDVPSHAYSFSYAQRRDWPKLCPEQPEILDYLHTVAREFGVADLIVTGAKVASCRWTEPGWRVETADGRSFDGDALILATGQLHQPAYPPIPGIEDFAGHSFHSAQWDHDYDLTGKRVAVIGTGASAVQFVPAIAPKVAKLVVFQRSGNWFLPRKNRPYPGWLRTLNAKVPGFQRARRALMFANLETLTIMIRHPKLLGPLGRLRSTLFMRSQLKDPELRRKVWPDYTFGCKRVLFSSYFLPALGRPNVELVTSAVTAIEKNGPVSADGQVHEVDCIIYGTGFKTNDFMFPMEITGAGGRSLKQAWERGAHAHLGMTVPGFPSMFVLYGPNTNTSGGSIIFYLERQARYLRQALALVRSSGAAAIDVRPEVEAASDKAVQARFAGTAWTGCDSWYRNGEGRIIANWPGYMGEYAKATSTLDPSDFTLVPKTAPKATVTAT